MWESPITAQFFTPPQRTSLAMRLYSPSPAPGVGLGLGTHFANAMWQK